MTVERHYCWMDPTTEPGRLLTPRSDPMQYESAADLLFNSEDDAKAWLAEELAAWHDGAEPTDEAEVAYINSWVLCIRTVETVTEVTRMDTFPAHIDPTPTDMDELRAVIDQLDDGSGLACHWGDPIACAADNNKRASWAAKAVLAYADITFGGGGGEDFPTVIGDLLGDLMHLCDLLDVTFESLCDKAVSHYQPELQGTL